MADRENRRVQSFTTDGKFVKQLVKTDTPFARDLALSPDPEQQFLYVGNGDDIVIVDRKTLEIVGTIKLPGMIGGGHQIATDSKGNLYIAQTTNGHAEADVQRDVACRQVRLARYRGCGTAFVPASACSSLASTRACGRR